MIRTVMCFLTGGLLGGGTAGQHRTDQVSMFLSGLFLAAT
jgi:hypothetical protein